MKKRRGWQDMPQNPYQTYKGADGKTYTHFEAGIPQPTNLPHDLYGIPTGELRPWIKESAAAGKFIMSQEGFVGVHPMEGYTMWFFDTLNHAKVARNRITEQGAEVGTYISHFVVGDDGVPEWREAL